MYLLSKGTRKVRRNESTIQAAAIAYRGTKSTVYERILVSISAELDKQQQDSERTTVGPLITSSNPPASTSGD